MARELERELEPVDISDSPDLLQLAQEVAATGVGRVLRTEQGDLAKIVPVAKPRKRRTRGRPLTKDDPLFRLIGIGSSGDGESDASERKHEILARAYLPREDR